MARRQRRPQACRRARDEVSALGVWVRQLSVRDVKCLDVESAAKHVRDTAVDVALAATRSLLREQVGSGRSGALVEEAIAELPRRLH